MSNDVYKCGCIALAGPANAGKSTLFNAYLGEKLAIVTAKPQTTRNQITGILTLDDAQLIFFDTPGLHERRGRLYKILVDVAKQSMASADGIILVLDAALYVSRPQALDPDLQQVKYSLQAGQPVVIALNKIDMFHDKSKMLPLLSRLSEDFPGVEIFPISALTGAGLEPLLQAVLGFLPENAPMYPADQLTTLPMRFMAAELVREKLFNRLRQELPYSIAVDIESWDEPEDSELVSISAVIYVTKKSHKAIVIGNKGQGLKEVGTLARKELESFLEKKVYLELFVKIREGWTESPSFLRQLGYPV